ncbi:putative phosphopantetheine adenylyltransferase [Trichinella spiralis]|uniref:putative phosphopantetheine adenylyltransferase n=1 Tax=Trichinella spiralis TaxID=6334 RepID=UPI0001EFD001|nr:putative phosphopantetheine adenylyltransferase [Trichinella spiralis]
MQQCCFQKYNISPHPTATTARQLLHRFNRSTMTFCDIVGKTSIDRCAQGLVHYSVDWSIVGQRKKLNANYNILTETDTWLSFLFSCLKIMTNHHTSLHSVGILFSSISTLCTEQAQPTARPIVFFSFIQQTNAVCFAQI